jgi:hypothetical protein
MHARSEKLTSSPADAISAHAAITASRNDR